MRAYMLDADATDELQPIGRISILTDADGDGVYEGYKVFLDDLVLQIEGLDGAVAGAHFRVGQRADDEIIQLGEELDVDLIVIGSKGKGTLKRALMGSDSESIVRYSRQPVLVVRD